MTFILDEYLFPLNFPSSIFFKRTVFFKEKVLLINLWNVHLQLDIKVLHQNFFNRDIGKSVIFIKFTSFISYFASKDTGVFLHFLELFLRCCESNTFHYIRSLSYITKHVCWFNIAFLSHLCYSEINNTIETFIKLLRIQQKIR